MIYVLDTNTVSFILKGDSNTISRMTGKPRSCVKLPQPVISEIEYGIERLPQSKRKTRLEHRWNLLKEELGRIQWTDDVSRAFAGIKAFLEKRGQTIEDFDVAIAAHAARDDAVLVTANTSHMSRIRDLSIEDWT